MNLLKLATDYLEHHNMDISPEELFIEFQTIIEEHREFEDYLRQNKHNEKLETMRRSERSLQKRKLFIKWYIEKYQNNRLLKELHLDLSEMIFASERTVREDIISMEATACKR